jgi:hypothetical protein
MIDAMIRRFTDRKVYCVSCGEFLGYVWRKGHKDWACGLHSGNGEVRAILDPNPPKPCLT